MRVKINSVCVAQIVDFAACGHEFKRLSIQETIDNAETGALRLLLPFPYRHSFTMCYRW